jgi:hypothetical protein
MAKLFVNYATGIAGISFGFAGEGCDTCLVEVWIGKHKFTKTVEGIPLHAFRGKNPTEILRRVFNNRVIKLTNGREILVLKLSIRKDGDGVIKFIQLY